VVAIGDGHAEGVGDQSGGLVRIDRTAVSGTRKLNRARQGRKAFKFLVRPCAGGDDMTSTKLARPVEARSEPEDAYPDPADARARRHRQPDSDPTVPIRVDYELTPLGQGLYGLLSQVRDWAADKADEVDNARNRHDSCPADHQHR
jgi:hypothetical protein